MSLFYVYYDNLLRRIKRKKRLYCVRSRDTNISNMWTEHKILIETIKETVHIIILRIL